MIWMTFKESIALAIASRVVEAKQDDRHGDVKLQELRIVASRIAQNLGLNQNAFLKQCGFEFARIPAAMPVTVLTVPK